MPTPPMRYLIFDISNLLHRTFFVQRDVDEETLTGLATHGALVTLNKYYKMYKPNKVICAFDRSSWRKEYTASDKCISKKPYKGNRRKDMTEAQQAKYARFLNHLAEFEALIYQYTSMVSLVCELCEADDLIGGFCRVYEGDEIIVMSADSDLLQLTRYPNVQVISPATDKAQSLDKFDNDPLYYLFQKCIRGDPTDNVQSAFPNVRATRIKKAYEDDFERIQLMKETWSNGDTEYVVGDLFAENEKLIDLTKQPVDIQRRILTTISNEMDRQHGFSMFHFLKFVGKYQLIRIKEGIDQYVPMLSR
jgi:hypothetical protein